MSECDPVHHLPPSGDPRPERAKELRRLEAAGEAGIDTAAIPPAPAGVWRHARRGPVTPADLEVMRGFFRPVSLRLDADVLHWSRGRGRSWQTEISRTLKAHIERIG